MREDDPDPRTVPIETPHGRNLKLAIATGLTLAALVIGLLLLGPAPFFALVFVIVLVAQAEFYGAIRKAGYDPATALGLVAGGVLMVGTFTRGESAAGFVLFLTLIFSFVWFVAMDNRPDLVVNVAVTILGVAYIPLLGSFIALMVPRSDGVSVILVTVGAAAVYDVLAYAGGSRFGRRVLAPQISPNKTIEGSAIATVGLIAVGAPIVALIGPWNYWQGLIFTAAVAVVAPFGDLVESLIKRDLGVKDMGAVFPGHGGALDRVDAILFVAPVAYLSLKIFGL